MRDCSGRMVWIFLVLIFSLVACDGDASREQKESAPFEVPETQSYAVEGNAELAPETADERVIDVIARDFSIEAPEKMHTGWYTMRLQNQGQQTHFVIMYRLAEGKTIEDQLREVVPAFDDVMVGLRNGEIEKEDIGTRHTSMGMLTQVNVTEQGDEGAEPEADTSISISNDGIEAPDTLPAGRQTIWVDIKDRPDTFMPYDVNLAKLDDEAGLDDIIFWMDWSNIGGLRAPAPVEFLGGVEHMEAGNHGYMSVDLSPGQYLWISEINAGEMHKVFTVE